MAHDVAVLGATIAGLTAARRLAAEGYDVVVLDPNPAGVSAAVGHGVAACAHTSTVARMEAAYGPEAVREHVWRNLAGIDEIRTVATAGGVSIDTLELHDHSYGVTLDRELSEMARLLAEAGAEVWPLRRDERRQAGAGLGSRALVLSPVDYAEALLAQAKAAGARLHSDVTVTSLLRRDGESLVRFRPNFAWQHDVGQLRASAVIDTLGVSPWGRMAAVGEAQLVPMVGFVPAEPIDQVTLRAGPPVWLVRPVGDHEAVAFGPKAHGAVAESETAALSRWVQAELGATGIDTGALRIDPSDHGRPVVGASATPGGFYARGNGRGELMNGTASGTYLASLLIGTVGGAKRNALPMWSRVRAQARHAAGRVIGRDCA
ncbi:MAG: NAD(P)/FAD-dependent oxidoreductase [Arachnia sp.]